MVPGEIRTAGGSLELNANRAVLDLLVVNSGDRPVQVGSHYHFFEVNRALRVPREAAFGMRLDIPDGTAVRFEPGEEKPVRLVELGGARLAYGLNGLTRGETVREALTDRVRADWQKWEGAAK